ncbi:MAG: hypothetical protein IPM24_11965 [Bryobacterales bacterium]|nr:hypothetical protein [Bryobacterales bacterium]
MQHSISRRSFAAAAALSPLPLLGQRKKRVAAIITEYRHMSHADVIVGRILNGYMTNNRRVEPRTEIVSMYTDQVPGNDMSRDLSKKHGFPIYPTIAEALTMGTGKLAVDAVLLIGEHGNYRENEKGQKMYPRYELFSKITDVFREQKRGLPLFNDKHLSYRWDYADAMYKASRDLKFPFMAGSSIPVTVRYPELEVPLGAKIGKAVVVGYGGLDAYGFHTLESLQCMVERRGKGETGVASVEWIEGSAVWQWRDGAGAWSKPLLDAALARMSEARPITGRMEDNVKQPVAFLVRYRDGLEAVAYMLNNHARGWSVGLDIEGRSEPASCRFGGEPGLRQLAHFDGLVHCIEEQFVTGKPPLPIERTLLTTGTLAFLFDSRMAKKRIDTPQLAISYRPARDTFFQRA